MRQKLERWLQRDRPGWRVYLFSIVVTMLALGLLSRLPGEPPVGLALLAATVYVAYIAGMGPALLSVATGLLVTRPAVEPIAAVFGWNVSRGPVLQSPLIYVSAGFIVISGMQAMHRARRRIEIDDRLHKSTLANISDAVITTDPAGYIEYLNGAATRLLQIEFETAKGKLFDTLADIRDEDGGKLKALSEQARRADTTVHFGVQQVLHRADGKHIPIELIAAPVRDVNGTLIYVVFTLRDCSKQHQIESVLRERIELQSRLERLAAVVPGALFEFQILPDGRRVFSYATLAFKEITGMDLADLKDDSALFDTATHVDDRARVEQIIKSATAELKSLHVEHRLSTPHRGLRWLAISAVPVLTAEGLCLWHGMMIDITEHKRSEEKLRASQLQLNTALQAGDMGIFKIDVATHTVEMDAAARRLWGMPAAVAATATLSLKDLQQRIHPDDPKGAEFNGGELQDGCSAEYHLLLDNQEERWLTARGRLYQDELTGAHMKVGIVMDTTQQRRVEQQRLNAQKLEALGVLASGIAHDFNNLLLAISGNTRLLLADLPEVDSMRVSLGEIAKASARAAALVRRILSFSSASELDHPTQTIPLRPVLEEVIGLARAGLPASVAISTTLAERLPEVRADAGQLHQVFINLLTNAADAAHVAEAKINLAATTVEVPGEAPVAELPAGRYVRLTVTDNGSGIQPTHLHRIFDPFFTTKAAGRGTGLGLAIVHGIVKSLGGAITVTSTPGLGASFAVYLPAASPASIELPVQSMDQAQSLGPSQHSAAQTFASVSLSKPVRILYVDDEEALVFLMRRTLERLGHRVTACSSPEEALAQFIAHSDEFDVVVSDMAMPGTSGIELAEKVLAIRPRVPFIITSGYVDAQDAERARAVGVRQIILKPNTVDELGGALLGVLQQQIN